jgi:hypothetical protein
MAQPTCQRKDESSDPPRVAWHQPASLDLEVSASLRVEQHVEGDGVMLTTEPPPLTEGEPVLRQVEKADLTQEASARAVDRVSAPRSVATSSATR